MNKQHRQYVILIVVLLACAASVFIGVKSILHSNDEMTTFAVGDWEGITLPRYHGPAVYSTPAQQGYTVTMPMTSTSSRSLFHHNAAYAYHAGVTTTQRVQTGNGAYRVYQTSDQEVHSIGSGNGSSGGASIGTTNVGSSVGSSFSMPSVALTLPSVRTRTLANNNILSANTASTSAIVADAGTVTRMSRASGIRRIHMEGDEKYGDYDGEYDPATGKIWSGDEEGGEWIDPPDVNTEKWVNGVLCVWTGSGWVPKSDVPEPDAPIGDIPWMMLLLAAAAFGTYRMRKSNNVIVTTK